jgi:hypothetical protein
VYFVGLPSATVLAFGLLLELAAGSNDERAYACGAQDSDGASIFTSGIDPAGECLSEFVDG